MPAALRRFLGLGTGTFIDLLQSFGNADYTPQDVGSCKANTGSINTGGAVYASAAGVVTKGIATSAAAATVVGLAGTTLGTSSPGPMIFRGIYVQATALWDSITGQSGGLTPGSWYYLDPTTAQRLTKTAPSTSGQYVTIVGLAISSTELLVLPQPPRIIP